MKKEVLNRLQKTASHISGVFFQFSLSATGEFSIPYSSEGIEITFRLSPEQVREDANLIFKRIYADDYDDFVNSIHQSAQDLTVWSHEFRVQFEDGSIHWLNGNAAPQRKQDGSTLWDGFVTDISERKRMEEALHNREAFAHSILNSITSHIAVLDSNGVIIAVNEAWRTFAQENGMSESYHYGLGKNYFDVCKTAIDKANIEDAIMAQEAIMSVLSGSRDSFEFEYPCHSPTAENWYSMSISRLAGTQQGAVVKHENITQRKKIEIQLQIAATAFEAQEGIMICDTNNIILRVNKAFTEITGYRSEEVIGQSPNILSSGQQDANFYNQMWTAIKANGHWNGKIWNRRKSGEIYPEHLSITVVKDSEGNIVNYVATLTDITMSKTAAEEIKRLAFYDSLTDLPNRRLLVDRLQMALASNKRSGCNTALLFIDVDNFKTLNDTLGHDVGDLLLRKIALRLKSCVTHSDSVARFGGDEFVIMLEDLNETVVEALAQVEAIAGQILMECAKNYSLGKYDYTVTLSIGATLLSDDQQAYEEFFKQADIAMYQAKKAGGNALRFFDPQMQTAINERVALENDLHTALAEQQFELYYQLQTTSEQIVGAEVLIRWHHPQRGFVSPDAFIPLAEEIGLILPIGRWVLETACQQIKYWENHEQTQHLTLAVNVSAKQFHQLNFVEQVAEIIKQTGIKPNRLKLELTESSLVENIAEIIKKMTELRKIGVLFSMDDFGTGYSSLSYLTQLPFNQLKIDQSFIRNIGIHPSDAIIVQTIIGMAKNLGMEVIAEGVETEDQRAFLARNGCFVYQGYLFAKPLPLAEFEALHTYPK